MLSLIGEELGIENGHMEDKEDRARSLGAIIDCERKLEQEGY